MMPDTFDVMTAAPDTATVTEHSQAEQTGQALPADEGGQE